MNNTSKIFVAGHTGLVGSSIIRKLEKDGFNNLLTKKHAELDLTRQKDVEDFFEKERPEYVIDAAAMVGGIKANNEKPADFFSVNMSIECNLILSAHKYGIKKFLFLGSSCMYPRDCPQPMTENSLLEGKPETTNEGYALAKIAGSKMCSYMKKQYGDNYITAIPANTYGPGDCFDPERSHVIPALLVKFHNAKVKKSPEVTMWGTGKALREFIHTDDIADSCIFLLRNYDEVAPINVGTGKEYSMAELAQIIMETVGYKGRVLYDNTKPDGMPRRIMNSDRIKAMNWSPSISLEEGIKKLYNSYLQGA